MLRAGRPFALTVVFVAHVTSQNAPYERLPDGIRLQTPDGYVTLHVRGDSIVRVTFAKATEFHADDMVVVGPKEPTAVHWTISSGPTSVTLATATLRVRVARDNGAVTFADAYGRTILAEAAGGHRLTPADVQGERTFHVQQIWEANDDESLYGLGQRQEGKLDIKGYDFDLWQRNTVVEMPMFVSSRGYGILWDNTAPSKFGDIAPFESLAATAESITAPVTGDYQFQTYSNGDMKVWLDGVLQIDHYKQNWAAEYDQFKVHLEGGRQYPLKVTNRGGTVVELRWKKPTPPSTSIWSEVGEGVDYYFIYGPELDEVIAGYRALTGRASMLPDWAFGFWQSRNKYNTQDEILKTVAEFRRRQIPMDAIVQDWQYWPVDEWGDHEFEASRYPDPDAMIKAIHDQHAHFMISVWGKFYPTTNNYKAMDAIHALYPTTAKDHVKDWLNREYSFYDTFNVDARRLFWAQLNRALFRRGVDAWWMDATEPDVVQPSPPTLESMRRFIDRTAAGIASRVMSAYPLMSSKAVYDGQRSTAPDQRVFILTRSGFAGIQRYATVTWSGDITSTFQTLRKQITAGLGFSISGDPYWTTDAGGYTMDDRLAQAKDGQALDEWQELNARWFEYSTFCPILRVHGTDRPREMWNIGDEQSGVYQTEMKFDILRHALFPYIYSVAGAVNHDGSTMMRPLVMDFRHDAKARSLADEYMFGPAFLVSPVTEYKARTRPVYLPANSGWYDFWTGTHLTGGQTITAEAPFDRLPVYVRAGSIVPMVGQTQQYVGENRDAQVILFVYAAANAHFSLYEDDGHTYGYERGEFSRIPIDWNEATRTLTIGARTGTYPGIPRTRSFFVELVTPQNPIGYATQATGVTVTYTGTMVRTRMP
ncbi:MAG TPA: TIM-barrel domain-containing protein [Vicinamibacterales bacterium]|nr:TIM-barrel domain-containing protein [Vicinamibacterales bacterium]